MRAQTLFKPLHRRLTVLLVLLAAVSGLLLPSASPASADTPRRQTSWTWMEVEGWGHADLRTAYRALIASIRNAAGHHLEDGMYVTQNEPEALISVRLYNGDNWVRLWIEPHNLYLRGFTNQHGTFSANDREYSLHTQLLTYGTHHSGDQNTGFQFNSLESQLLPFNSTYTSLENTGGTARHELHISAESMWNHFFQLAWVQNPGAAGHREATARSYLFFTQFLSEAVRFDDVSYYMEAAMGTYGWNRDGMGHNQIALEQNWGSISDWARNARTAVTNPAPLYIAGAGITLYNWYNVLPILNVAKHR
ncbi:ribosome-inactivating family protein [Streptomyces sp. NPDC060322]|uniref:ribosome-inactivating family protein n=1 Tax=Streptomyces sp. NPDC060322 TaxID=3347097 RepID=UPI0036520583